MCTSRHVQWWISFRNASPQHEDEIVDEDTQAADADSQQWWQQVLELVELHHRAPQPDEGSLHTPASEEMECSFLTSSGSQRQNTSTRSSFSSFGCSGEFASLSMRGTSTPQSSEPLPHAEPSAQGISASLSGGVAFSDEAQPPAQHPTRGSSWPSFAYLKEKARKAHDLLRRRRRSTS